MSRIWIGLVLMIGLTACDDVVGLGGDCTRQMMEVRLREGDPSRVIPAGDDRNRIEYWEYGDRVVIFEWGATTKGCQVREEALATFLRALARS